MARGNRYAFEYLFVWRRTSAGLAVGQLDPDALGTNVTSHAYQCYGPLTITEPDPTYKTYEFRSGGGYEGKALGGIESLGSGEITLSQLDPALRALLVGGLVDTTTVDGWTISAGNKIAPSPRQVGLLAITRNQSRESATEGTATYINRFYPMVQVRMKDPNATHEGGENPQAVTLVFEPTKVTKFPNGVAFGANQSWYQNSEYSFEAELNYPLALTTFVGNNSATTFTLGFLPKYSTVTDGDTNNWVTVDSVVTAPTSISVDTGLVTMASAPASGKIVNVIYPTEFLTA